MKRWMAGLVAILVLPACGDGSGGSPATDAATAGQATSVRIIDPDSGATRQEGATITIHAVVTDPSAEVSRVDFYDDNRVIGGKSSPPYTISYRRLDAGAHLLCAVAVVTDGTTVASPPVTLFVVRRDDDDDDDRRRRDRKD